MTYTGGTSPQGSALQTSQLDAFIPELWQTEIKKYLEDNLVMANFIRRVPFTGKAGDRIRLPELGRLGVNTKLPASPVTFQSRSEKEYTMVIDQYKESSIAVEDIAQIQSHTDMRQLYTMEAGRALARDLDDSLLSLRASVKGENPAEHDITSNNPIAYSDILDAWEVLNSKRVPKDGRVLVISPQQEASMLASGSLQSVFINRENSGNISDPKTGVIGQILGVPVVTTTALQKNSATAFTNGDDAEPSPTPGYSENALYYPSQDTAVGLNGSNYDDRYTAILMHSEYANLAIQKEPSVDASWSTEFQEWHVVQTMIYGFKLFRPDHAVIITTDEDGVST